MRWKRGRGRDQIEDRRGQSPSGGFGGGLGGILGRGGGFPLPAGRGGLSIGAVVVVLIILAVLWFTGAFGGSDQGASNGVAPGVSGAPDPDADLVDFVGFVVDDVQDFWRADFRTDGRTYQTTKIVLFTGQTQSGCGMASSETGPFYCPVDRKVFLDLGFFRELATQFQAPGDFAEAYVIAHEFGHHVQGCGLGGGRPHPALGGGAGEPGDLDPRLRRPAVPVAPDRVRHRRSPGLRHVQRQHLSPGVARADIIRPIGAACPGPFGGGAMGRRGRTREAVKASWGSSSRATSGTCDPTAPPVVPSSSPAEPGVTTRSGGNQ